MNIDGIYRLLLLAAAADMSLNDVRDEILHLKLMDEKDIESYYRKIKKNIRDLDFASNISIRPTASQSTNRNEEITGVRNEVLSLFRQANVSSPEAARMIQNKLAHLKDKNVDNISNYNPRDGFNRWVERLIKHLGPALVLNIAVDAINEMSKFKNDRDWKLSR